jgi:4-hydroxybenzoate polyprenyltransferase
MDEPERPKPRRTRKPIDAAAPTPAKVPRKRAAAAPSETAAPPPTPRKRVAKPKADPAATVTAEANDAAASAPVRRSSRTRTASAVVADAALVTQAVDGQVAAVSESISVSTEAQPRETPEHSAAPPAPTAPRATLPETTDEKVAERPTRTPESIAPPAIDARQRPARHTEAAPAPPMIPSFARKSVPPPLPANTRASAQRPADASPRSAKILDALIARLPPKYRERTREYLVLMRLDRPVGALLLLWPTWWALWFAANDFPPLGALFIFTLGVFVMRSAGCVINDYADHGWLDANVERTRARPMAAGRVSKKEALILFGGLLAFAFVLVLFTNALTIKLSFVGAALAAIYPFTKRVTHLAQVVLGAAFGWSIPMAFAAVTDSLPPLCWLLFLANVLFSTIYDTEYAMVDRDDDLRVGAKSTAILFGDADRAIIGVLMVTFVFAMLLAGTRAHLHWPYYLGLMIAIGLFGYQQWLIRTRERMACFAAFRNNNATGLVLWLGLLLALAIR